LEPAWPISTPTAHIEPEYAEYIVGKVEYFVGKVLPTSVLGAFKLDGC
jgi:hypothetical protein